MLPRKGTHPKRLINFDFTPRIRNDGRSAANERILTKLKVNGRSVTLSLEPWVTLLDALREHLQLTGTKKGCDHGQCGACTVLVNGARINFCLTFAAMYEGQEINCLRRPSPAAP